MKIFVVTLSTLSLLRLAAGLPHATQRFHRRVDIITHYITANSPEVIVWVHEDGRTAGLETITLGSSYATSPPVKVETGLSVEPTPIRLTSPFEVAAPSPVQVYAGSFSPGGGAPPTPTAEAPPTPSLPVEEAAAALSSGLASPINQLESVPAAVSSGLASPINQLESVSAALSSGLASPVNQLESVPAPVPEPAQLPSPAPNSPPAGLGICYSPYNADGTCKTQNQVDSDIRNVFQSGYRTVRLYGVDCNQIRTVTTAASTHGIRIFAGLLTISNVAGELASMISQVNNHFDPDVITTISIGNELVDMGKAGPGDVVAAVGMAREILREAGYQGAVVTVDTFNALIKHPELCAASDYCAANAHAFFDGTVEPEGAGDWVVKQVGRISDAAAGAGAGAGAVQGRDDGRNKKVVITESGWPHAGASNGAAVPSPENQARALESIRAAFADDLFVFSAFDDKWKDPGAFGVEKNWGIIYPEGPN